MPTMEVPLSRETGEMLSEIGSRLDCELPALIERMIDSLIAFDRELIGTGLAGIRREDIPEPPAFDPEGSTVLVTVPREAGWESYLELCRRLAAGPVELAAILARGLAGENRRHIERYKSPLCRGFPKDMSELALEYALEHGLYCVSGNIRPRPCVWPADKPFPLTDAECAALVRGYKVRWRGEFDDFLEHLPGKYEMTDGFLYIHQP